MTSILLHIGAPKCGSTYLQRALLKNVQILRGTGIAYPHDGARHPGNALSLLSQGASNLSNILSQHRLLILSHEDLFAQPGLAAPLYQAAATHDAHVRIAIFVRPFPEIIFGDYSQHVKQFGRTWSEGNRAFGGRDFRQVVLSRRKDFCIETVVAAWSRRYPNWTIDVRPSREIKPFIGNQLPSGLALDWNVPRALTNRSLPPQLCEEIVAQPDHLSANPEALRSSNTPAETDWTATHARTQWIDRVFASSNAFLKTRFGINNQSHLP
ncbi:MAG: hypothetical protein AAF330_01705 [Pseudomonadota bacterium]